MEYYSAIKMNEVLMNTTAWLNLANDGLRERSQSQRTTYNLIQVI